MFFKPCTVRMCLTLWYVAVLAIIILVFALGVFIFIKASLLHQIDEHNERDFATVARAVKDGPLNLIDLAAHGNVLLFRVEPGALPAVDTDAWNRAGLGEIESLKNISGWFRTANGTPYRIKTGTVRTGGIDLPIAVAHDGLSYRQSIKSLTIILSLAIPAALALAVVGGYFLAGRALSPLGVMAAKAREITAERLSERLPVENPDDEFGQLANVFNDAFLRLEDSFERLKRFTADASHELRTPLTAIRSVGEVGMHNNLDAAACREVIGSMLEEADRLTKLVDSLLLLSRADSGGTPLLREKVDLAVLTNEVCDCLLVLAEEKGQKVSVHTPQPVYAVIDRGTIAQALINLLDNAIKYTPSGGAIQVETTLTDKGARISVMDDGPGVALEHRERIYERFYRVDQGRAREVGGAGLGLSIAQWAVAANNGQITLESCEGKGSTFSIILPLSRQPSERTTGA